MLILSGRVVYQPEDLASIRSAALEMVAASRAEDGCIEYEFSEVMGEPGVMRIFERWESREHLAVRGSTDHMATWRAAGAGIEAISRDLSIYEGEIAIEPL